MTIITNREQRCQLARDNSKLGAEFRPLASSEVRTPPGFRRAWRSRDFLVQEFDAPAPALVRLSVNRTSLDGDRWSENITWDELQRIKTECGYPLHDAVEIYPAAVDVVNVAAMRHLWILKERLSFAWRN